MRDTVGDAVFSALYHDWRTEQDQAVCSGLSDGQNTTDRTPAFAGRAPLSVSAENAVSPRPLGGEWILLKRARALRPPRASAGTAPGALDFHAVIALIAARWFTGARNLAGIASARAP